MGQGMAKDVYGTTQQHPPARSMATGDKTLIAFYRAKWMRALGAPAEEIEECDMLGSLEEEIENVKALEQMQANNLSSSELKNLARKFRTPPSNR